MKNIFWLIFGLFLFSRFFFLANYPYFYDSPEYYRDSLSSSFISSLSVSHESVHPLYLFLTQTFQRIAIGLIGQPKIWVVSLVSAVFGIIAFLAWYFLIKRLFSKKIALFSLIPLIFFPHLWLIQTNVLHEAVEQGLFLLGLLFFDCYLKKNRTHWLILVLISWGLAIFNFIGIILWFLAAIGLVIFRSTKKEIWKNLFILFGIIALLFGLSTVLIYKILSLVMPAVGERVRTLLLGYGGGGVFRNWNLLNILRMLRNDFLILFHGYSIAAMLGGILGAVYLFKQRKYKTIIFVSLFVFSFIITGKFWYGGLFGRYSALVAYPLALLLGILPWRKIYWGLIVILIFSFLPTFIAYQRIPIPIIQANLLHQSGIKEDDLLILSDYQRPQLPYKNALYISGNQEIQKDIEQKMENALKEGQHVFISQQAITFPYWQYDGQQVHIISKGDKKKAQLKNFLGDKKLKLVAEDKNYPLFSIYRIE